jgi:hypothetical protein
MGKQSQKVPALLPEKENACSSSKIERKRAQVEPRKSKGASRKKQASGKMGEGKDGIDGSPRRTRKTRGGSRANSSDGTTGIHAASRDDLAVASALHTGQEIDAMYELSEAGLLDEFFVFLEVLGMMKVIDDLKLPNVKRVLVPSVQFVLLYMMRVLYGVESMNALPKLLFSHIGLMKLIGFNATQIQEGLTARGESRRKTKEKQGPITPQCLTKNICKLTREQMEQLFDQMVRCLVRMGLQKARTDGGIGWE